MWLLKTFGCEEHSQLTADIDSSSNNVSVCVLLSTAAPALHWKHQLQTWSQKMGLRIEAKQQDLSQELTRV